MDKPNANGNIYTKEAFEKALQYWKENKGINQFVSTSDSEFVEVEMRGQGALVDGKVIDYKFDSIGIVNGKETRKT